MFKFDYSLNRQKRCTSIDYLLNSQKLLCSMQKNVQQKLVHTWRPIGCNKQQAVLTVDAFIGVHWTLKFLPLKCFTRL